MTQSIQKKAEIYCADKSLRLTDPRRLVLGIIEGADKPLGAYDVLQQLGQYLDNPKPPTAYRAIEFWIEHGFVHRIESLNAYIACHADHAHTGSQYLICTNCQKVEEIHLCSMPPKLSEKAEDKGFSPSFWNVEIHGHCAQCRT